MTTLDYSLADRYRREDGRVFLTGIQALARLPIEQLRADKLNGLSTAAFLSGYPGSPLGGLDQEMVRAAKQVPELAIKVAPAVNEELAATAVMGTQLVANQADQRYDGVVGYWYGKGPGLDRASDALRHAVFAGSSPSGGAVAIIGDDPASKSSTLPTWSDPVLAGLLMPVFHPGDVHEILDLGRHAVALSRLAGVWTSLKILSPVADASGTVDLAPQLLVPVVPDLVVDGSSFVPKVDGRLLAPYTIDMEQELREVRFEITRRYGVANDLNSCPIDPDEAWIGIAASGYTYREVRQALHRLGFDSDQEVSGAGIRLLKLGMPYPLDEGVVRHFARGLEEIVVVEEKGPTLERLMKDALYRSADSPLVVGKKDDQGNRLMASHSLLDADRIIGGLRSRLEPRLADRMIPADPPARERTPIPLSTIRKPYFCSGCPHNWGTKVPDGALVGVGVGCHGMVLLMDEEKVGELAANTAMGSEGAQWIGMAPFLERDHFIQNLGDGTFFHSGQLAIQGAIDAGVNLTYKLLYNGTVAMTGGQDAAGAVGVPEIVAILSNHGVARILITTEDIDDYDGVTLTRGRDGSPTEVWDRSRMVEAQEMLATVAGVTVLIHDQACAAQTRRLRKRGEAVTPGHRVVINHRLCEACGHCGEVSNCLSVQTVHTPLGPKTAIDQTTCNLDFSCLGGDCPSFMTVTPNLAQAPGAGPRPVPTTELHPPTSIVGREQVAIRLAGIGGTGVVTVAQVLGTAAMLDGWDVRGLDQTGLSQKAGPVVSDLRLSRSGPAVSNLVGAKEADVIVAFDLLAGASESMLNTASADRTVMIASTTPTQTGEMIGHPDIAYPDQGTLGLMADRVTRVEHNRYVDAGAITKGIHGDGATANLFLLGVAVQAGAVPVAPEAVESAIDLNGVAVETNLASFRWGRTWVVDEAAVVSTAGLEAGSGPALFQVHVGQLPSKLEAMVTALDVDDETKARIRMLGADLVDYQNKAYATRFLAVVAATATAEAEVKPGSSDLTEAVATGLHKLMAYKDEYEVARLLLSPEATTAAEAVGGAGADVHWRLHPALLRALGISRKLSIPASTGRPLMKTLTRAKRLRGTSLDPFGRAEVRRVERALVEEYTEAMSLLVSDLGADTFDEAVATARLAQEVRGYETIKLERAAFVRERLRRH
ncbi:MAG: indolepyruvate ferredoxin oxidoreductase family protein [Actinomycetia bacterium]|nr:indolepyruvate ferredoxin oxidoreductase family protein [Actinomycetes bacterium]